MEGGAEKYCNLLKYLKKHNPEFFDTIVEICGTHLLTFRKDTIFLMPNKELTKKIVKSTDREATLYDCAKLFIKEDKKSNYNHKQVNVNFKDLKELYNDTADNSKTFKMTVYAWDKDTFPEEGELVPRQKKSRSAKGSSECNKKKFICALMTYAASDQSHQKVLYSYMASLVHHCKATMDNDKFTDLMKKFDPNIIVTWYIFLQPGMCDNNNMNIPTDVFNEWCKDGKLSIDEDFPSNCKTGYLLDILNTTKTNIEKINETNKQRVELKNETSDTELLKKIKETYDNNLITVLEDEIRFVYSECDLIEILKEHIQNLTIIDWNGPEEQLIVLCKPVYGEKYNCLLKFIQSDAFHYQYLDDNVMEKIEKALKNKEGAGSGRKTKKMFTILGLKHKQKLKEMGSKDHTQMFKNLVNSLSSDQKKLLKSLLK